ncbi:anhydro-N-acetylmuramic acid kinase [Mariniphaga sediminis]|uniref:Anhydro-N-acetylmuramic acid kinase n=1 Tax=Mariniphaga sediminis TaxID=1628158 RepID=A0A399D634_9BACT|nr:anhydro-N-acetylmuramic acid kinase [Mariniphaga sediminis]RIH67037.1 anhydro-N-acetylmuramic acid kinase [Mariniphaga sediminis]
MKPHSGNKYRVIGIMSGTSLDGIDLAVVDFSYKQNRWNFSIISAETAQYSGEWYQKLKNAPELPGEKLVALHNEYGRFIGQEANRFLRQNNLVVELIASHGHTVFHQPENGFTFQAGSGASVAAETGITTVADFRSTDVALGGHGAPLVPVGDKLLFPEYDYCLNLGGFANISFEQNEKRVAFDICPINFILNDLAEKLGLPFDKNGNLGRAGNTDEKLLRQLNQLDFYSQSSPKSLGREWMNEYFLPVINSYQIPIADKLRTVYEHIALQISGTVPGSGKMLVTGGGTFNSFLMECIKTHSKAEITIPTDQLIHFKEAIVFAFLGLLRFLGQINCYASVTGSRKDSSSGIIYPA